MADRFSELKKLPKQPARRLLALANMKLDTDLSAPAASSTEEVLRELDGAGAPLDMLRLIAASLPPREAIWWACLAAEDIVPEGAAAPAPLARARDWVFKPTEETREAARATLDMAEPEDDTALCAQAVAMADGTLGPGDLAQYEAPPGAVQTLVFGMNLVSMGRAEAEAFEDRIATLIERGLDIARGGNGRLPGEAGSGGAIGGSA